MKPIKLKCQELYPDLYDDMSDDEFEEMARNEWNVDVETMLENRKRQRTGVSQKVDLFLIIHHPQSEQAKLLNVLPLGLL